MLKRRNSRRPARHWPALLLTVGLGLAATATPNSAANAAGPRDAVVYRDHAGFDQGTAAYDKGDYVAAFAAWLPLAQDGDPAAQRNVGHLYRHGLGVAQDFERAFAWYLRAAELGLSRAQSNLAEMYLRGQGTPVDAAEAARWFETAARQGHAVSQYRLAQLLLRGQGVVANPKAALAWLQLAADAGYGPAREALGRAKQRLKATGD